jgi:predicted membrane protein
VSKNFRGGEIVNFFGGSEINLMQADINGRVHLEVVQVFGGTKIIVPSNWTVHSEMVAIFGGIEDKRPPQLNVAAEKVLVIQGTSIFGGIDIKSF